MQRKQLHHVTGTHHIHIELLVILVHVLLITSVHCIESLVWFEVSDFGCIINTEPSLGLLLDNLLFYVMEIL